MGFLSVGWFNPFALMYRRVNTGQPLPFDTSGRTGVVVVVVVPFDKLRANGWWASVDSCGLPDDF
jgi:hypothetical protein